MAYTHYSQRQHGDPDVEVTFTDHDGDHCTGWVDARRQVDGRWQAFVRYSKQVAGMPARYSAWAWTDELTVGGVVTGCVGAAAPTLLPTPHLLV